jgi:hypothetical protein
MTRMARTRRITILAAACSVLAFGGCGSDGDEEKQTTDGAQTGNGQSSLPQGSEPVELDPADFTNRIDNPYWPMAPGSKWVYRGEEGGSEVQVEVTVTNKRKQVEGVEARVLLDVVTGNGKLIERTYDWYAQDSAGNVWYLGEDTKEYENGKVVSTGGAWESGVDGAEAGIIMPGKPRVGLSYRQEYYEGEAEDEARVVGLNEKVEVPFGRFQDVLKTEDTTPLEPNLVENKYYARGVGPVLKASASGGGREELVEFRRQ